MERLKKIGRVTPKRSADVNVSRLGIGFEKLDRNVFDPEKAYDRVAELGVKWVRLQSGWERTEKQKGVYDFAWLDRIVDRMISIGVEPWLCLCYGNPLYTEEAKKYFGSVGIPPIGTQEERDAWAAYVRATVQHFKGRIRWYEVWNEPDGIWCWKHGPNAAELAEFTKATAKACRQADPECKVIGLVLCEDDAFAEAAVRAGALEGLDAVSYHAYTIDERIWKDRIALFRRLCDENGRADLRIIQGESGTQSRSDGAGALRGGAWTQAKQQKYLLRHLITDLAHGVEFTSYFSCMDMIEALNGLNGQTASYLDYGYFGVLGADFDENGRSVGTYTPKPSYYALQNLCSILAEVYESCAMPADAVVLESRRLLSHDFDFAGSEHYCFKRENGSYALFYWVPKNILTETYEGTVSLRLHDEVKEEKIVLIDPADGSVYDLSEGMRSGEMLINLPIRDVPLLLCIGDFCAWD